MPLLRENGPYLHATWLPRLLVGLDHCEWKIWFQAHHDGRSWTRLPSDFDSTAYNLAHTALMRLRARDYEERGFTVRIEHQNEFRVHLAGAAVSGRMDLVASRGEELVIIDAKAARPSQAHQVQVMVYMMLSVMLQRDRNETARIHGEIYYGEDHTVSVPAGTVGKDFRDLVTELVERLTSRDAPRKVPSASECRFCPIGKDYCPERVETGIETG